MKLNEFLKAIPLGDLDQDIKDAPYSAGLYVIVNTVTWQAYIGQSKLIARRFQGHRATLRGGRHSNRRLQEAWNKYGEAVFRFCVFEMIDKSLLLESEGRLIAASVSSCYNQQITPVVRGLSPSQSVKKSNAALIARGGRRIPDGYLQPHEAQALAELLAAGYAQSAAGVVARALLDAQKGLKKVALDA
ncbi:MAG: GIY-YIG nuclease family protein [Polaromonas sp.]